MGRFALQMMGAVGELERNTIIDNVKLGMAQRTRKGRWNGGICLGYRSEILGSNTRGDNDKKLVVVPEEAVIIHKIFNMYSQGKGLRAIANYLNREGYKTKRGNTFSTDSIKEIILNPLYVGKVRFNRYQNWSERKRKGKSEDVIVVDGIHEPIISQELWDKVQAIQQQKANKPIKNYEGNYVLTGLIKCPVCGFNSIKADYIEEYVLNRINEVVNQPKLLKTLVTKVNQHKKKMVKPLQMELETVNKSLETIQTNKKKYLNLYETDLIDQDMFKGRIKELNDEMEKLMLREDEIEDTLQGCNLDELPFDYVKEVLANLDAMLQNMASSEKKVLYQLIIQEVVIKDKKVQEIKLKIDYRTGTRRHYEEIPIRQKIGWGYFCA